MVQINDSLLSVWYVKPSVISWLKAARHAATDKATAKKTTEKTVSHMSKLFGITVFENIKMFYSTLIFS